jgi:hypothetical protein
MTLDNLESNT